MSGTKLDKARCYRHRPRAHRSYLPVETEPLDVQSIHQRSPEEIAAFVNDLSEACKAHEYRMQTDPLYRKQKRKEELKFNLYMFFHDYWTFKRYLTFPLRCLMQKFRFTK